jgi:hypothetical protein
MRNKLRGVPAIVIAGVALFVALGGGYAIGAGFIGTGDLKNQAVTNKKIKKKTIKANRVAPKTLTGDQVAPNTLTGEQINEATLSGAGTGLSVSQTTAATVPGGTTTPATVLTLQVPQAGSYVFFSKGVLARATAGNVDCLLTAEGDSDRSLAASVDSAHNTTISNTVAHTFTGPGSVTMACSNPAAGILLVTDRRIEGIPVGALSSSSLP